MKKIAGILAIILALAVPCSACSYLADMPNAEPAKAVEVVRLSKNSNSEDGPWLPDVNTAFGAEGEYYGENTEENGITYDFYYYDFEADAETVGNAIVAYTEALKELDYTAKKLKNSTAAWYESYTKDGYSAELGIFVTGNGKEIKNGGSGKWRAVLAIPKGMVFKAGSGAPGVRDGKIVCVGCNGSGKCSGCGGSGSANYGDGRETCVNCKGSGICNLCDGEGAY